MASAERIRDLARMTSTGRVQLDRETATFANRYDTREGQQTMQDLHDVAARGGAVCTISKAAKMARSAACSTFTEQGRRVAQMASAHEHAAIVQAHDMAVDAGARCSNPAVASAVRSLFSASVADPTRVDKLIRMTSLGCTAISNPDHSATHKDVASAQGGVAWR